MPHSYHLNALDAGSKGALRLLEKKETLEGNLVGLCMARSVEAHTHFPGRAFSWKSSWKALTDVVKKRLEEAAGLLQVQELQNRDQILDIVQHHKSLSIRASLGEAGPDLEGDTLLESF